MKPLTIGRLQKSGLIFWQAIKKYVATDGEQRAASFAYYAFFAIIPLLLLVVMAGSIFYDYTEVANHVLDVVSEYVPSISGEAGRRSNVIDVVQGVINSRRSASAVAIVVVVWCSLGFFHALVRGVNRAWGTLEYPWWRLPFANLLMVGIVCSALIIGIVAPLVLTALQGFLAAKHPGAAATTAGQFLNFARLLIPTLVLFYGFTMFYKYAPREKPKFAGVWTAALFVAVGLQVVQKLFVLYARNITNFNKIYGAFGGVVAFLLWIYLSGTLIIFGGCLCAARAEVLGEKKPQGGGVMQEDRS
jgi:YihY family inner membrane protein